MNVDVLSGFDIGAQPEGWVGVHVHPSRVLQTFKSKHRKFARRNLREV